jgi:hypothetical protein
VNGSSQPARPVVKPAIGPAKDFFRLGNRVCPQIWQYAICLVVVIFVAEGGFIGGLLILGQWLTLAEQDRRSASGSCSGAEI